jgi:hypothetical protein
MLNVSLQKQADPNIDTFGGKYNEVIIDSAEYRDQLPASIAAVFFTQVRIRVRVRVGVRVGVEVRARVKGQRWGWGSGPSGLGSGLGLE